MALHLVYLGYYRNKREIPSCFFLHERLKICNLFPYMIESSTTYSIKLKELKLHIDRDWCPLWT